MKELAYFSLVRSFADYCSTVWDPHQKYNHDKLEMVQRRAARFVKSKYKRTESVTMGARRGEQEGALAPPPGNSQIWAPPPQG